MKNLEQLMDIDRVSIDEEAVHPDTGEKVKDVFCSHWEQSRKGLELLQIAVKNPIVQLIIFAILTLGNGLNKRFCNE